LSGFLDLAAQNLLSPMVLFFALGLAAALARSDLTIPESIAKAMAIYLMMSIGFKGGASISDVGIDLRLVGAMVGGAALSFAIPLLGFALLRATTKLSRVDAAAVAAHYGSISIVTFVAGTQVVTSLRLPYEGWIVAVAAVMEMPAILSAMWLARRASGPRDDGESAERSELMREILLNGSIVVLVGSFLIGWITGPAGMTAVRPFLVDLFQGVLCLFLLDMGLVAGRGLRTARRELTPPLLAFGVYMPLISAGIAALVAFPLGLSVGGTALFVVLAASASYIAVPAAMRVALPEARPSIYLTMSLGVTFPFNLTLGIPLYLLIAQWIGR
jgi:hypothetical protein